MFGFVLKEVFMKKNNEINARKFHLCHLNIAPAQAPIHDPIMAGFVENLDKVNQLAYQSPGFVWHLKIDINNPEDLALYGEVGILFNLSAWESVEALWNYTYKSEHSLIIKRRREWFKEVEGFNYVLWWKAAGELPSLEEAKARLHYLNTHGPTEHAFIFKKQFSPPSNALGIDILRELKLPASV